MFNWLLVEESTGKIINAVATPVEGVMPEPENEGQEVIAITDTDFKGIMQQEYQYYNYPTQQLEPEIVRKLVLITPGPYAIGTVNLVFEQRDINGAPVTMPTTFTVDINGQIQEVLVDDGTLEITLDCPEPTTAIINITGYRHQSITQEVVIDG